MSEQLKTKLVLKNVRLSFPSIFSPRAFSAGQDAKYSALFILDKEANSQTIEAVQSLHNKMAKDFWKGKIPSACKFCLRDGTEKEDTDGYSEDVMFISASAKVRPQIVDQDPRIDLEESSGRPYAGCFVNAAIRFWVQDSHGSKRINGQLLAVQFLRDGDAFGSGTIDAEEEFENVSTDKDDSYSNLL